LRIRGRALPPDFHPVRVETDQLPAKADLLRSNKAQGGVFELDVLVIPIQLDPVREADGFAVDPHLVPTRVVRRIGVQGQGGGIESEWRPLLVANHSRPALGLPHGGLVAALAFDVGQTVALAIGNGFEPAELAGHKLIQIGLARSEDAARGAEPEEIPASSSA
jgi:hypothetical protein